MKYIRTKSGFITTKERNDMLTATVSGLIEKYGDNDPIIKQADTIEELCDGFVVVCNGRSLKHKYFKTFDKAQKYYRDLTLCAYSKSQVKIYGIICSYNDKLIPELKSVAKINDEGDLCLI